MPKRGCHRPACNPAAFPSRHWRPLTRWHGVHSSPSGTIQTNRSVRVVHHIQFNQRLTADILEVWIFPIELFEENTKHSFEARSDMTWKDFKDCIVAQLDLMEVRLNFCLNVDTHAWSDLSCKANFVDTMICVAGKCLVAHTQEVTMEVKNMASKTYYP